MKRLLILISFLLGASIAHAACSGSSPTRTAASAANTDVQSCVTAAVNGDTILVPAGTVSYGTTAVDIPNSKCLTINGQGGVTITSAYGFTMETGTSCESRVTGFTFNNAGGNPPTTPINATTTASSFCGRVDHNTFTNSAQSIFLAVSGNGPFLIDHNTFTGGGASEMIHNLGTGAGNNNGWTDTITPGGPNMVFVEANTFNNTSTTVIASGIESFYGARTVLRYNVYNYVQIDQHGDSGSSVNAGSRWWEIYNDVFNALGLNQPSMVVVRSGSGIIANLTTDGTNTHGSNALDLQNDVSGTWPLAWQPGAGWNSVANGYSTCSGSLNNAPAQLWNNPAFTAVAGASVQLSRDYFVNSTQPATIHWKENSTDTCSTTYAYAPYTYPHPLDTSGGSTVSQPQTPASLQSTVN